MGNCVCERRYFDLSESPDKKRAQAKRQRKTNRKLKGMSRVLMADILIFIKE